MNNIYVGNLSFDTTEQDVRSLFEPYGTVDRVNIVTYPDTGQPRGFALSKCSMTPKEIRQSPLSTVGTPVVECLRLTRPVPKQSVRAAGGGHRPDKSNRFGREAARNPPKRQVLT